MEYSRKIIKYLLFVIAIGMLAYLLYSCWFVATFHGDTYGKSEAYVIDINSNMDDKYFDSSDIVDLLYDFQCSHTQYQLMNTNVNGDIYYDFSHKIANRTDQYMVFFYFEDINMVFSCITEVTSRNHTLIKLYAVNEGSVFRHWERINNYEEISYEKNKMVKKKFETEILDSLGIKWRQKKIWD